MLSYYVLYLRNLLAPLREEKGQDLLEYVMIIALISIILMASLTLLKGDIAGLFATILAAFG